MTVLASLEAMTPLGTLLPTGWTLKPLGSVCTKIGSGATPRGGSTAYTDSGTAFIRSQNVYDHKFSKAGLAFINEDAAAKLSNVCVQSHDVLLNITGDGDTIARCCVVPTDLLPARVSQHVVIIRTGPEIVPEYLQRYLSHPTIRQYMLNHNSGGSRRALTKGQIDKFQIVVPPFQEQRAIAEVLGALDDKIAANTKLAATASELAGLTYDQVASQFESRPMSEVLKPILGGTPPRARDDFWMGDRLWASAKDITGADFGVVTDTDEKITDLAVTSTKAKPLPTGSVILTARGTVGAVARLAEPASFNQSCYGFIPGPVPPGVLYFSVLRGTQRAKEIAHGSVFDTITMKTFDHLAFPNFDGEALVSTERRISPVLAAISAAVAENRKLAATRDALLPQLMSGKLQVREAEELVSAVV